MKILQVSDIHLDFYAKRLGSLHIVNGENIVYKERVERLRSIIQTGIEQKVDAFALTGDIHNKSRPTPQEYYDFYEILDLIPPEIKVFVIPGNHDESTDRGCPLQPLVGRRENIVVALEAKLINFKGIDIILAPWGTTFEKIKAINKLCLSEQKILMYHVGVLTKGFNWGEIDGEPGTIPLEDLEELGMNAIMLGHYHGQVELSHNIWYAGSPECFNFGEERHEKGFLIWNIDETAKRRSGVTVTPFKTTYPKFYTFDAKEFLALVTPKIDGFIRVTGEVTEEVRARVLSKLRDFECLDSKLDLTSQMKARKLFSLKGKSNIEILQNYLEGKGVDNIEKLIDVDSDIEGMTQ